MLLEQSIQKRLGLARIIAKEQFRQTQLNGKMLRCERDRFFVVGPRLRNVLAEFAQSATPEQPLSLIKRVTPMLKPGIHAPFCQAKFEDAQAAFDQAFEN